jgi:hypothetical protein
MKIVLYILALVAAFTIIIQIDQYLMKEGGYDDNSYIYEYSIGDPDSR